jgi:diamine N-acetyltransferase
VPKRPIQPLVNDRVRLRLLQESDLPLTLAWRNADDIRKWFFSTAIIGADQHRAWFEQYKVRDDDFVFVVEETQTLGRAVGQAALYHVDWSARRAEFGRLMIGDPEARGLGLARLALSRLLQHAHTVWSLREVYLECFADNVRAIDVYAACGFEKVSDDGTVVRMASWNPMDPARA